MAHTDSGPRSSATTTELLRVHPGGRGDRTIYATDVVDPDQRGYRLRARRAQHDEVVSGEVPQPPSFYEFTLEVAAIAPSILPRWSLSISEAIAHVRGERSMTSNRNSLGPPVDDHGTKALTRSAMSIPDSIDACASVVEALVAGLH